MTQKVENLEQRLSIFEPDVLFVVARYEWESGTN
jgi:hypothetical protein